MPGKRKRNIGSISKHARASRIARRNETPEQTQLRRLEQAARAAAKRAAETPEQAQARRQRSAEYSASKRAAKTSELHQARLRQCAADRASRQAAETQELMAQVRRQLTPEQSLAQRQQRANYIAYQRAIKQMAAESSKRANAAEVTAQRPQTFTRNTISKTAFLDYATRKLINIKTMKVHCRYCGALKWKKEAADTALNTFETRRVDSNVYPQSCHCEEVQIEQDDPLSLPGPSCESTDEDNVNVKLEYQTETQETDVTLEGEEFDTEDYNTEVKVEVEFEENKEDNKCEYAADSEDTERIFEPSVVLE